MYQIKKIYWPIIIPIDLIGNALFFWKKLRKQPEIPKKALFIRLEHIGDMIMATPTFETFKKNNPNCEVHVLCKNLTAPLIKNNPFIDKIIIYDAPWFNKRNVDTAKTFKEVVSELRQGRYDLVFEMHGDPRNNYLALKTGAYTIGYSCRGLGFLLNKTKKYDTNTHNIKQNLSLITDYSKKITETMSIFTDKKAQQEANMTMGKNHLKTKEFIIINPLSGRPEKNLTVQEVNNLINKHKNTKIILTGAKNEAEFNQKFKKHTNIIDLTGKTDLLTLTELVRNAKKVIAPDTGIIHIAKAVNTPIEAIYKTTEKKRWGY